MNFKNKFTLEERQSKSSNILLKFPTRKPLIITKSIGTNKLNDLDKNKYLVPDDINISQLYYIIRKRIYITSDQAIFLMNDNRILHSGDSILDAYNKYKDIDGFLYITYSPEKTFG